MRVTTDFGYYDENYYNIGRNYIIYYYLHSGPYAL